MNAGFSNLATLKAHLLGAALQSSTEFDTVLAALGLGMAGAIESYCSRKFLRTVGATEIFSADYAHFRLSRFPLEAITKVETKTSEADGWVEQTLSEFARTIDLAEGIVYLETDAGDDLSRVRFTITGGYFWNQLEPTDNGYPTATPSGATVLPDDLKFAWLLQCQEVWNKRDKLGMAIADAPDKQVTLAELKLIPLVQQMVRDYVRENYV